MAVVPARGLASCQYLIGILKGHGRKVVVNHANGNRVVITVNHDFLGQLFWRYHPSDAQTGEGEYFRHTRCTNAFMVDIDNGRDHPVSDLAGPSIDLVTE
jgi:hypothetical protein